MTKELTNSNIDRQNILNNPYAVEEIQKALGLQGIEFEGKVCFTKKQITDFYEISNSTVERYLVTHDEELTKNGYEVLKGQKLKKFKEKFTAEASNQAKKKEVTFINDGNLYAPQIGIFDFRSFLNIGMLLTESEKAKEIRSVMLDIVIDIINKKSGGQTKYINQREESFLLSSFHEENYRKKFTEALHKYVKGGNAKFAIYTNKIYKSVFKENAKEYREILKLSQKDKTRETLYSEILDLISAYENGLSKAIEKAFDEKGAQLLMKELDTVYKEFEEMHEAVLEPSLHKGRSKMASRDLCFRDALHKELKEYVGEVSQLDFEKFLGEKSKELNERIEGHKEIFKRLNYR